MQRLLAAIIVLLLSSLMIYTPHSPEHNEDSNRSQAGQVISSQEITIDTTALTISAPHIPHKWQLDLLFPSDTILPNLFVGCIPFIISNHVGFISDSSGFLSVVMNHSNNLS